jgi:hypothetical protein
LTLSISANRSVLCIEKSDGVVFLSTRNRMTKFILPSRRAFIESFLPLGRAINLNPFHRLNEAHPEHGFQPLAAWRLPFGGADAG